MSSNATYASAFPPLASFPSKKRYSANILPLTPLKCPQYLEHTGFARLLQEERQHQREPVKRLEDAGKGLDLWLPTHWSEEEKSRHVTVGRDGLDLAYAGPGKDDSCAASARANFPMHPQCGIYYFEMLVLSKGQDGFIGVGFCTQQCDLEHLPGWTADSWGYHGDDGHAFTGSGTGRRYGPSFSSGDVIGCGVNFAARSAFFTKNGTFLGDAFTDINTSAPLYPTVGLRTRGEHIAANFGQVPFVFDIAQHVNEQKHNAWETISKHNLKHSKNIMDQLIMSYLVHHGCSGTAKALCSEAKAATTTTLKLSCDASENENEQDLVDRACVRAAIINGQMDLAMTLLQTRFPDVMFKEQDLLFELKCGKFIQMVQEYARHGSTQEANKTRDDDSGYFDYDSANTSSGSIQSISSNNVFEEDESELTLLRDGVAPNMDSRSTPAYPRPSTGVFTVPVGAPGRRLSWAAIAASPTSPKANKFPPFPPSSGSISPENFDFDHGMYRPVGRRSSSFSSCYSSSSGSATLSYDFSLEEEDEEEDESRWGTTFLKRVMQYGQQLQEEYRHDDRQTVKARLVVIFSLLAYPDPRDSPVAYLFEKSERDVLATKINAAIIAHQQQPRVPALEQLYRQAVVVNKTLALAGHGKAALVHLEERCFGV